MRVRRLGWASVEVHHDDDFLVVDLFLDNAPLEPFTGELHEPLLAPQRAGEASGALVTHLHADHADPAAIAAALRPGAPVLRPRAAPYEGLDTAATVGAEMAFDQHGLSPEQLEPWEAREIGPFTVTALPAVDGFGDPQVSWAIEAGGKRIVHMGDTIFHGSWWLIPMRVGAIDLALLPVNGPVVSLPHRQPANPYVSAMNPEQAATAAQIMGASRAVPIHYDAIHKPPVYVQTDDPVGRFVTAARAVDVEAVVLGTGEEVEV